MPKIDTTLRKKEKEQEYLSFSETVANEKDPEIIIPALAIASHIVWRIRTFLAYQVNLGTSQILWLQKIRNPYLDVYLEFASVCGSEVFYFFLMPFLYIVFDPTLARLLNLLFGFSVLTGNFLKNIFCLPRPPSKIVWKPQKSDTQLDCRDFGFPSTHSINAVSLPFMILRYFYGFAWVWEYDSPIFISCLYLFAFGWAGSIIFSRMYLGVHSPTDTTGGMFIGAIILRLFLYYSDSLDMWTLTSRYVPHTMLLFSAIFLLIHPQTRPASYSYAETTALLGWLTGSLCGTSFSAGYYVPLLESLSYQPNSNYYVICLLAFVRYIFGMALMQAAQTASKMILTKAFRAVNLLPLPDERVPHSDLSICETLVKYLSYVVMGFVIGSGLPLLIDSQFRSVVGL